jgi:hypothetical protein
MPHSSPGASSLPESMAVHAARDEIDVSDLRCGNPADLSLK